MEKVKNISIIVIASILLIGSASFVTYKYFVLENTTEQVVNFINNSVAAQQKAVETQPTK